MQPTVQLHWRINLIWMNLWACSKWGLLCFHLLGKKLKSPSVPQLRFPLNKISYWNEGLCSTSYANELWKTLSYFPTLYTAYIPTRDCKASSCSVKNRNKSLEIPLGMWLRSCANQLRGKPWGWESSQQCWYREMLFLLPQSNDEMHQHCKKPSWLHVQLHSAFPPWLVH